MLTSLTGKVFLDRFPEYFQAVPVMYPTTHSAFLKSIFAYCVVRLKAFAGIFGTASVMMHSLSIIIVDVGKLRHEISCGSVKIEHISMSRFP